MARLRGGRPVAARQAAGLLARLESYRKQSGLIVGELYALTARALLKRLEAVEDLKAERRFRQRSKSRPRSPAPALPAVAAAATSSPSSNPETTH